MQFFDSKNVDEVKEILRNSIKFIAGSELVEVQECIGRIIFKDIIAEVNVPEFRKSTVDGYAVNARDTFGATEQINGILNYKGEVQMGTQCNVSIENIGECMYVPTGAMIPSGATAVIMIENTEKLDEHTILINSQIAPGENVVDIGEDIKVHEIIIKKGTEIRPYEIGVLASLGYSKVEVFKKPVVGILSTGDEIVEVCKVPKIGQVRDINGYVLYSSLVKDGCTPINFGIVKDNNECVKESIEKALKQCDIILVSGGSSVGEKDYVYEVIENFENSKILVKGIAIKPGKPTIIGKVGEKIIFGLPGHPLSCSIIYEVIVKSFIENILCNSKEDYGIVCKFKINYHKSKGREEYLPVRLVEADGEIIAEPIISKSGIITSFSKAYGYIRINKNLEGIKAEEKVMVYKL